MLSCFSCRLHGVPFYVSFLAPVLLILLLNSIAFVLILHSLLSSGSKITSDRKVTGFQQFRRGATVLILLGLTWLFGVLAISDAKIVSQYLFCIFNSLQGLFVFVFYCVFSSENRKRYKSIVLRKVLTEAGSQNTTNLNIELDSAGVKGTETAKERNGETPQRRFVTFHSSEVQK